MAKGFWRGQAAQYNIFGKWMTDYMQGLGGEGFQNLLGTLWEAQGPNMMEALGKYGHQTAGFGQAVPGQGFSGQAQAGERDLMSQFGADIMGTALQTYAMPWQGLFGSTAGMQQTYMGTKAGPTAAEQLQQPMGGCCFIFAEANDGILDRIARRWRDENGTSKAKSGYKRLASWLVPKMKKSKAIKNLVKFFMVKPMIQAGKFAYRENNWGHIFVPLAIAWMILFETLGMRHDYVYSPCA